MSEDKEQLLQDTLLFCNDLIRHLTRDGYELTKRYIGLETRAKRLFIPDLNAHPPSLSSVKSQVMTQVSGDIPFDKRLSDHKEKITRLAVNENPKNRLPF